MTRGRAIALLRTYKRRTCQYNPEFVSFPKGNGYFKSCVYRRYLIDEIINRLRNSNEDPIELVYGYYSKFDELLINTDADHVETQRFVGLMEEEAGDILRYLKVKEKEENGFKQSASNR